MPQIPINPFDNDRLKTRKVQENLAGLGALPSDRTKLPTFLRSRRSAAVLIDRALEDLAPNPMLSAAGANSRAFAAAVNAKFTVAFSAGGSGGGGDWPLVLDFKNNSYTSATATYDLTDVWVSDTDFGNGGDLANVQNGVGLVNTRLGTQDFHFADIFSELVSAGPIVVLDFTLDGQPTSAVYGNLYEETDFTCSSFQIGNGTPNSIKDSNLTIVSLPQLTNGAHKLAIRFHSDRYAASIDGGSLIVFDNPAPGDFPYTRLMISLQNADGTSVLRSATFRDPAEGEGVLQALSAL